jgi:hypothetical protein
MVTFWSSDTMISTPLVEEDEVGGSGGGPVVMRTACVPLISTRPSVPSPVASRVMTQVPGTTGGKGGVLSNSIWFAWSV